MAYKSAKQGWYKVINPEKVIKPADNYMKSFIIEENEIKLNFKSSLERTCMRYCDMNIHVKHYGLEPFAIKYLSPKDGKIHRYFIDFFIEFSNGQKFLVEVKSSGETREPKIPGKKTEKAILNYQKALQTFAVNQAKWSAAKAFASVNGFKFIILTERELK